MRIIVAIMLACSLMMNNTFAFDLIPNANNFLRLGYDSDASNGLSTPNLVNSFDNALGIGLLTILQLLYKVGAAVAVCVLAFMGVKIVLASPQQKAQLKASLFPYFVGLILLIAGVPLAILIIELIMQVF